MRTIESCDGRRVDIAMNNDGIVTLAFPGDLLSFDLRELRAAIESESFESGPVIPGAPGAKAGRRSV